MTQEDEVQFPAETLVRVARQPENQFVGLVGEVGFVYEVQKGDLREVYTLRVDGSMGGCGSIPVSCLQDASSDADVVRRKGLYDVERAAYLTTTVERSAKIRAGLSALALKYLLPVDIIRQLHSEVSELYR